MMLFFVRKFYCLLLFVLFYPSSPSLCCFLLVIIDHHQCLCLLANQHFLSLTLPPFSSDFILFCFLLFFIFFIFLCLRDCTLLRNCIRILSPSFALVCLCVCLSFFSLVWFVFVLCCLLLLSHRISTPSSLSLT